MARWATGDLLPDLTVCSTSEPARPWARSPRRTGWRGPEQRSTSAPERCFSSSPRRIRTATSSCRPASREDWIAGQVAAPGRPSCCHSGLAGSGHDGLGRLWVEPSATRSVALLQRAVAGDAHAMSHAWLITGPPGSGRSNAARAFAAALQCVSGGCGECSACRTSLSRRPSGRDAGAYRATVDRRGRGPRTGSPGRHDAHPGPAPGDCGRGRRPGHRTRRRCVAQEHRGAGRTHRLDALCADSGRRGGHHPVALPKGRTVHTDRHGGGRVVVRRDGVPSALAAFAARVAQGHVGRARQLARDEEARSRRADVLKMPARLVSLPDCLTAAANLVEAATEEAAATTTVLDAGEGRVGRSARLRHAGGPATQGAGGHAASSRTSRRRAPSGCSGTPSIGC